MGIPPETAGDDLSTLSEVDWDRGGELEHANPNHPEELLHTDRDLTLPRVELRGFGARSAMTPEWVVALSALGVGLWGLRRTSPRRVPV